jgi:hypothetical protein
MYTQENFNEVIRLLREIQELCHGDDDKAQTEEVALSEQMEQGRSLWYNRDITSRSRDTSADDAITAIPRKRGYTHEDSSSGGMIALIAVQ